MVNKKTDVPSDLSDIYKELVTLLPAGTRKESIPSEIADVVKMLDPGAAPHFEGLPAGQQEAFLQHFAARLSLDRLTDAVTGVVKKANQAAVTERGRLFDFALSVSANREEALPTVLKMCDEQPVAIKVADRDDPILAAVSLRLKGDKSEISRAMTLFRFAAKHDGSDSFSYHGEIASGDDLTTAIAKYGSITKMLNAGRAYFKGDPSYNLETELAKRAKNTNAKLFGNEEFAIELAEADSLPTGKITFMAESTTDGKVRFVDFDFGNEPFNVTMRKRIEAGYSSQPFIDLLAQVSELVLRAVANRTNEHTKVVFTNEGGAVAARVFDDNRSGPIGTVGSTAADGGWDEWPTDDAMPATLALTGKQVRGLSNVLLKFEGFRPVVTAEGLNLVREDGSTFEALQQAQQATGAKALDLADGLKVTNDGITIAATARPIVGAASPIGEVHGTSVWFNESLAKGFNRDVNRIKDKRTGHLILGQSSLRLRVDGADMYTLDLVTEPLTDLPETGYDAEYYLTDLRYVARLLMQAKGGRIWFGHKGMRVATQRGDMTFDIVIPRSTGNGHDHDMVTVTAPATTEQAA